MSVPRKAYRLSEFLAAYGISHSKYYALPAEDKPAEYRVGKLVFISDEAAEAWQRKMEAKALESATE